MTELTLPHPLEAEVLGETLTRYKGQIKKKVADTLDRINEHTEELRFFQQYKKDLLDAYDSNSIDKMYSVLNNKYRG